MFRGVLAAAPLLLAVLAACGGEDPAPRAEVPARWNTGIAADVQTLAGETGTVFVGEVSEKSGQATRDGFPVSLFGITVTDAGNGAVAPGQALTFEQAGGIAEDHDGRLVEVVLEGDTPLETGATYLFFATLRDDGVYTAAPFSRFLIAGGTHIQAPSEWAGLGASRALDGATMSDALRMVQDAAR